MASAKRLALAVLALALILFLSRGFWLGAIGRALVNTQSPVRSDAALVLAGDQRGDRILKGCELAQAGYAPAVLVSGPMEFYGVNEADLAIRFAEARGCPPGLLQPVHIQALSTLEEASAMLPRLRERGVHRLLVVTSDYHTARAGRIYRRLLGREIEVRMIAAHDRYFSAAGWWESREGQKTVFFEVSKTIATWIGL